ncbi:ATP-binding protein [Actinoplanes sp. NPDC051475]|uniref:ATP-binding protein n=1 Tax=Actinoplanes sp. NPDC051475 TaxID=3157225 RepID=UPI00344E6912
MTAVRAARLGPTPVQLVLCLPPRAMLGYQLRHADRSQPLLFNTMPRARIAIAGRLAHTHRRFQVRLAPRPAAVRTARDLVAQACHTWQLPQLGHDASLIMSELAANAVEHARTDAVATVLADGPRLHLAVRDGDTRYPRLNPLAAAGRATPLDERGRGLQLVHALAAAWGAMPARSGKVVWATVSTDSPS